MAFSHVSSVGGTTTSSGTTIATSSTLSVSAGYLLCFAYGWIGATTSATITSSSNTAIVPSTCFFHENDTGEGIIFGSGQAYILEATAEASATFTLTLGASRNEKYITASLFSPTAGRRATFAGDSSDAIQFSFDNPVTSTNASVTTTDGLGYGQVFFQDQFVSDVTNSEQIGGVAATEAFQHPFIHTAWYRVLSANLTGAATATATQGDRNWIASVMLFGSEETGGGGGSASDVPGGGASRQNLARNAIYRMKRRDRIYVPAHLAA